MRLSKLQRVVTRTQLVQAERPARVKDFKTGDRVRLDSGRKLYTVVRRDHAHDAVLITRDVRSRVMLRIYSNELRRLTKVDDK